MKRPCPCTMTRRELLGRAGMGFGSVALTALLEERGLLAADDNAGPLAPRRPHHAARAKSVIWLFMEGGPSAFDTLDPKPELERRHGQRVQGIETHFGNPGPLMKSPFTFRQHGECGVWVCDRMPALARHVDEIALIKSCRAESPNHAPAMFQINTGLTRPGFPSVGSWVTYGLGTENRNLPGFIVMSNTIGSKGGPLNWGPGFLPATFQGTQVRSRGRAILNLDRAPDVSVEQQRDILDLAAHLNARHLAERPGDPELSARVESFELAYRMQSEARDVVDLSRETDETRRLYGIGKGPSNAFGEKCLLARRMVERGVRFVQVYSNDEWDAHGDVRGNHSQRCAETDVPVAGLLTDLRRRGLLDSTLVVWGGEFGRMPVTEGKDGRDHNPHGFLTWMAGGGVKGGVSYGETDEIGYKAAVDPVSVHDLHATILHLLGMDHLKLTYLHNGRHYRLTDVEGEVLTRILV